MLLINAPKAAWAIGLAQSPPVFGFPVAAKQRNAEDLRACGLGVGAEFLAIAWHTALFRARVTLDPFISESQVWTDRVYPVRVQFEIVHELHAQWFSGRDIHSALVPLFARTLFKLSGNSLIKTAAFAPNPAQKLLF